MAEFILGIIFHDVLTTETEKATWKCNEAVCFPYVFIGLSKVSSVDYELNYLFLLSLIFYNLPMAFGIFKNKNALNILQLKLRCVCLMYPKLCTFYPRTLDAKLPILQLSNLGRLKNECFCQNHSLTGWLTSLQLHFSGLICFVQFNSYIVHQSGTVFCHGLYNLRNRKPNSSLWFVRSKQQKGKLHFPFKSKPHFLFKCD